jgi:hypothetical protein
MLGVEFPSPKRCLPPPAPQCDGRAMHSKSLTVLHAPHTQQVSILDISTHLSCAKDGLASAAAERTSGTRSRMSLGILIVVGLLGLMGLCVVVYRQAVIAPCVMDRTITVGDGIEFCAFLRAGNQPMEQTPVAGQEVVVG